MKVAIPGPGLTVSIVESAIPEPGPDQVVVKVSASGVNPKDWKMSDLWRIPNPGDDIGGIVNTVGANVLDLRPGDRVCALHRAGTPGSSFAEYALAEANTTFILPPSISFEEAATIPLNIHTAAAGLYLFLNLPEPWHPATEPTPLIAWGAGSAVGAYTVQLANLSNIHPIICVAGKSKGFVESLIDRSKGDTILDYRASEDAIKVGIKEAAGPHKILHAIEGVSSDRSAHIMGEVLAPGGKVGLVLFEKDYAGLPDHVISGKFNVMDVHETARDFGFVFSRFVGRRLQQGFLKPHPHKVVPGGLRGIPTAFKHLKEGTASATKYVVRIDETA